MTRPLCRWGVAALVLAAMPAARPNSAGPEFEVASVKVSDALGSATASHGGPGTDSPGQWTATSATVRYLVYMAWELDVYRRSGPKSMNSAWFDIVAKLPPGTNKHDFHLMLQRLLIDRIGLVIHHESKETELYEMVIAKGGVKLKSAEPAPALRTNGTVTLDKNGKSQLSPGIPHGLILQVPGGGIQAQGRMQTTADIARNFSSVIAAGRPVIDKTGLNGVFDYDVLYLPEFQGANVDDANTPGEYFAAAVERQLGLKLQSKKGPVDVVVIDSFNKTPTAN